MSKNSKGLVAKGIIWSGLQMIISQSFTFLVKLVLAKILFPEDFGVVGMAMVFTGFVRVLNDLGIGAALIQKKEETLTESHFHTAFWTGVGWSIFLYLIIGIIGSPLVASFYNEPILEKLVPVLSLGILASPVNLVHKAQLTKKMDFKKIALIQNTSDIFAGIFSIILALVGYGVWSLAFNSIASIVVAMPLYFLATRWTPKIIWNKSAFKEIFGFGLHTTGTNVLSFWVGNIDYLVIGKMLDSASLGVYTLAFVLTNTLRTRLMAIINNVMYPMYGQYQDNYRELKKLYFKVANYNAILVFPIMLVFIVVGDSIIFEFFGDKWAGAIQPLRFLSLAVMVQMMINSSTALMRGMGYPNIEFKQQIFKTIIFITTLVVGILTYGIIGASIAVLLNRILAVLIAQYTFYKLLPIKISPMEFFQAVKIPWIASIIAGTLSFITYDFLSVNYILIIGLILVIYFLILQYFMNIKISNLLKIKELVKNK